MSASLKPDPLTGWVKTMPLPKVDVVTGVPKVTDAARTGPATATSPNEAHSDRRCGPTGDGSSRDVHDPAAHARPAYRTSPCPFGTAPSRPLAASE